MSTATHAGPEAAAFRDIPADTLLAIQRNAGASALSPDLEAVDIMLQEADEPQPVLNIAVRTMLKTELPHVWMAMGKTEPGKGLQPDEDIKYTPVPNAPSLKTPIPGLAIPAQHDSISTVKFLPWPLQDGKVGAPASWWEHWQRHSFTQQDGDIKNVHEFDREVGFSRVLSSWFKEGDIVGNPIIVAHDPDASEVELVPAGTPCDLSRRAMFIGPYAVQSILSDTSRIAIPKEQAPETFHAMMATVADQLDLEYETR